MVYGCKGAIGSSYFAAGVAEAFESLLGAFVSEVSGGRALGNRLLATSLREPDACLDLVSKRKGHARR